MHQITSTQTLPLTLKQAWDFFSSPKNLKTITPDYLGFEILTDLSESSYNGGKMYPGQLIKYKVSPLLGIKMTWVTEIKHVKNLEFFVDEQLIGPYSIWHHKHMFKEITLPNNKPGVEMTDVVDYKLPLGILGKMVHPILVKNKVKEIFEYRHKKLEELWPLEAS